VAEHGERGLRALGGRREAERLLAEQPAGAAEPALVRLLEERYGSPGATRPAW
jgi:LAO/AO transport system kinase